MSDIFGRKVAMSMAMRHILDQLGRVNPRQHDKFVEHLVGGIQFYQDSFKKAERGAPLAIAIYNVIDEQIEEDMQKDPMSRQITCKAGCSACCHTAVLITPDEADLLVQMVTTGQIEIDKDLLKRQAEFVGTEKEWFNLPLTENKCVFLGEDKMCQIYEIRPISCRKYFVVSPPADCDVRSGEFSSPVSVKACVDAEITATAAFDFDHSCDFLPKLLLKALEGTDGKEKNSGSVVEPTDEGRGQQRLRAVPAPKDLA